ncbi:hypothetical protein HK100_006237, partial [Physocladia obscura]
AKNGLSCGTDQQLNDFLDLHESIMDMQPKLKELKTRKQTLEKELANVLVKKKVKSVNVGSFRIYVYTTPELRLMPYRLRPSGTLDQKD